MKISPFTPLFFDESSPSDGLPSRWVQVWSPSDEIMIQVFASPGEAEPTASIISAHSGLYYAERNGYIPCSNVKRS